MYTHLWDGKGKVNLLTTQEFNIVRKYIVDLIMEMRSRIQIYS
jgi:hypothetical protein